MAVGGGRDEGVDPGAGNVESSFLLFLLPFILFFYSFPLAE